MEKGDVTLKDIAKTVGKSVAAVSKALHDHQDISQETRDTIKQVALELGYQPNITAQRLQKRRTDSIGLILPVLSSRRADPFLTELLSGVADQAAAQGFDLLVSTRTPGPEENAAYQRLINQQHIDGVIIVQPRLDDWRIEFLRAYNLPFVTVGRFNPVSDAPGVWLDMAHGLTLAVSHLITQGRRHIALVPPPANLAIAEVCLAAFKAAIAEHSQIRSQISVEVEALAYKEGYRAAQSLLSGSDGAEIPDAIIACHDLLALGVLSAAQDQGFEIGSDIAVIGFGDIILAEYAHPPLTTVHQPTYAMGQQACEILIKLVKDEALPQRQTVIEPWLVVRQSSDLSLWL